MRAEADNGADNVTDSYVSVGQFFSDRSVFVTGGTGLLGKALVEKLLRSCPRIKVIYLLMRPKKELDIWARLADMINCPLFARLKQELPDAVDKIFPIQGDIREPALGISPSDQDLLARNVSVVFHSAATVKLDEPLKVAVEINLIGTKKLVELCRRMQDLQVLVHVSTCYSNCDLEDVQEVVYPPPYDPENIVQCTEWMEDDLLKHVTPRLLGKRPNTYTFTKALTESMLLKEGQFLPIAIVRPSLITSTWKEPMAGWIEGLHGATGLLMAYGKGLLWSMICDGEKVADIIPADVVVNLVICSAWRTATERPDRTVVYNCCSGTRRPITWDKMIHLWYNVIQDYPSQNALWGPSRNPFRKNKTIHKFTVIALQRIPAYVLDAIARISNKKRKMIRIQNQICKATEALSYFTMRQWRFSDDNTLHLSNCLSEEDRSTFFFDVADLDWKSYLKDFVLGIRRFIEKEDPVDVSQSRRAVPKCPCGRFRIS